MILSWRSLYSLYNGILGKCLIIISLATPIALMYNITSFIPQQFPIILIGALLALIGYIITEIKTPTLIKDFKDSHQYSTDLLKIAGNIDWISEFKILENNKAQLSNKIDGYSVTPFEFSSIDNARTFLGEDRALRSLALIKFNFCNERNIIIRLCLTLLLFCSIILTFSSTIIHVYTILIG